MDYVLVTGIKVAYALFAEYVNVKALQSWEYSKWIPAVLWLGVGIVPMMQWLILPLIIIVITKDHLKADNK